MNEKNTRVTPNVPDTSAELKRYLNILLKNKYWIAGITIFSTIAWLFLYFLFLEQEKTYDTSTVIRFSDQRGRATTTVGAVREFGNMSNESKAAVLQSNIFLGRVIDTLKLNVIIATPKIHRLELLKKIEVTTDVEFGVYEFIKTENSIEVYFTDRKKKVEDLLVYTERDLSKNDFKFQRPGLTLVLNQDPFDSKRKIKISIVPRTVAIEDLRKAMVTRMDPSQTLLQLIYSDKDPEFGAMVTNTMATLFLDQLLSYNRYQTTSVLKSMEEQYLVAAKELKDSEEAVRIFKENNPSVILANEQQTLANDLANREVSLSNFSHTREDLINLLSKKSQMTGNQNMRFVNEEILAFLIARNVPGSSSYSNQYETLFTDLQAFQDGNYSEENPQLINTKNQIANLERKIDESAQDYLNSLDKSRDQAQQNLSQSQSELRRMPRNQLRLAELERDRRVKDSILSSILSRINEARVNDAAIIADAFIIDEAQPPIVSNKLMDKLPFYVAGLFIGLIFSVVLFIGMDFLDSSVKSISDIEQKVHFPVLVTIPVIGSEKEIPEMKDLKKDYDPKLITSDYAPHIAGEKFRLLRTKLVLGDGRMKKTVLLTSLQPGEGKSLVAANLAVTCAQQKLTTLLIDADLRRGVLHHTFNLKKKPGLAEILVNKAPLALEDLILRLQNTHIPNLSLLSSGMQIPNPSELLGSARIKELLGMCEQKFDYIIIDTPPVEFIPDAIVLNSHIHNVLMVVRYGKTNLSKLKEKLNEYTSFHKDFQGLIINAHQDFSKKDKYTYSYYHY